MDEQDIRVEEFMRRIRRDLDARLHAGSGNAGLDVMSKIGDEMSLPRLRVSAGTIPQQKAYELRDLLAYHDEDFVANAYRAALRREPDPVGASGFLRNLREGTSSKVEVLGRIRFSAEGRAANVPIRGLGSAFAVRSLRRIPVLGPAVGVLQYFVRLPRVVRTLERLEAVVFYNDRRLRSEVNSVNAEAEQLITRLRREIDGTLVARERAADDREFALRSEAGRLSERVAALHASTEAEFAHHRGDLERARDGLRAAVGALAEVKADRSSLTAAIQEWRSVAADLNRAAAEASARLTSLHEQAESMSGSIREQERRHSVGMLEQQQKLSAAMLEQEQKLSVAMLEKEQKLSVSILEQERRLRILLDRESTAIPAARAERGHLLDGFYASFEDVFRGTPEDIQERIAVYLPYALEAHRATKGARAIDLGCGRGEWLDLLRRNSIDAIGIDTNRVMVNRCRSQGLDVIEQDALEYLRGMSDGSFGLLTAFHVIEHLPFDTLIAILDEARRVLLPGGLAIFETPNPENLIVGACNFWCDATHVRPLPPEPMRFIMSARGFQDVNVVRLHPRTGMPAVSDDSLQQEIAGRLYGPQDYALIGLKAPVAQW